MYEDSNVHSEQDSDQYDLYCQRKGTASGHLQGVEVRLKAKLEDGTK